MIEIDGSHGEGGGQMLRTALALSTLTLTPFSMKNIRCSRPSPGLKHQHLKSIELLRKCSSGHTGQLRLGQSEISFQPGPIKPGRYEIDIQTAGSITLLLQSIILPSLFALGRTKYLISGGTCGLHQPSTTYLEKILLPHLQRFADIRLRTLRRGYYPQGGGRIELSITPRPAVSSLISADTSESSYHEISPPEIPTTVSSNPDPPGSESLAANIIRRLGSVCHPYNLNRHSPPAVIKCYINLSQHFESEDLAIRIKRTVEQELRRFSATIPTITEIEYATASSSGGEIVLAAYLNIDPAEPIIVGSDVIYNPHTSAEQLAKTVVSKLISSLDSRACLDPYLTDQLLPFASLLPGSLLLCPQFTSHAQTNRDIISLFLPVSYSLTYPSFDQVQLMPKSSLTLMPGGQLPSSVLITISKKDL